MIIDLSNINSIKNRAGTSFSSVRTRLGDTIWPLNVTQHVCYDVVSSISSYQGTQTWVYDKTAAKWYVKNSSNDYEEYGQYASSSSDPGYEGKLGIWNQHEWKYTGSQWTDLGELEGTTTTITVPEYIERKSGYLGTFNLGRPFKTNTKIQVKVNKTRDGGDGGIICDYGVQGNWNDNNDWRVFWASGRLYYDYESGRQQVTTTGSEFEFEIGNYYVKNLSTNSNIINTTAKSAGRTNPMQISSSTDFMKYYYLKVYEGDELVMDLVPYKDTNNAYGFFDLVAKQALMPTGTVYGGGTETSYSYGDFEYLEEYDEMEAPEFTVTVSSMSELLARECVFVGQKAIVNGVKYQYTDNLEWEEITENPLTFTFSGSGTWMVIRRPATTKYSLNGADPVTLSGYSTTATTVNVSQGDTIQVWSNIKDATLSLDNFYYGMFGGTAPCTLSGNIMSMDREEDYLELTEISKNYEFYNMFRDYTGITDVSQLQLPATTLANHCYNSMFSGCTALTSAPTLPATTLTASCYNSMFYGCTGLTSAPSELPATTLATNCYNSMFYGCTSLTSVPSLPATTLASYCYRSMFQGCTSLTSAPALPATTLSSNYSNCYQNMFYGCTGLTSAPTLPATTLSEYCYSSMFQGCTSLTSAPTLPATTLANNCYNSMFKGCTGLTSAPTLPVTTLNVSSYNCYQEMFSGCTGLTSAPSLPATSLANRCYLGMFQGCTGLTSAPALPATVITVAGYQSMFQGCTGLTSAPALPATSLNQQCYQSMFQGCTGLTSAPSLPATTLTYNCYQSMFQGCTALTSAPSLPATTLTLECYRSMFQGCTSLTSAPTLPATTLANNCYNSMFKGCTGLTSAPTLPATTLASYCYNSMFYGCSKLDYIHVYQMPDDTQAQNWVSGVAGSGTFICDDTTYTPVYSDSQVPTGWTFKYAAAMNPLTFTFTGDGTLNIGATSAAGLKYKKNDGGLTSITSINYAQKNTINVVSGDVIKVYGNLKNVTPSSYSDMQVQIDGTAACSVSGNILSIVDDTDFDTLSTIPNNLTWYQMFSSHSGLTDASGLYMNHNLNAYQFYQMFYGCTALTAAPPLFATTLTDHCCYGMFNGCTSLTSGSALPATTLNDACYQNMFYGCTALTSAPSLPATTLSTDCYRQMFRGCSALTTAPYLPATTLANTCYRNMFYGCSSLNYIHVYQMSDDTQAQNWVTSVAGSGTFVCDDDTYTPVYSASQVPTGWDFINQSGKPLTFTFSGSGTWKINRRGNSTKYSLNGADPVTLNGSAISGTTVNVSQGDTIQVWSNLKDVAVSNYQYTWFGGTAACAVSGNISSLNNESDFIGKDQIQDNMCYQLFYNYTALTDASNLYLGSLHLKTSCYQSMFQGCTGLTSAPAILATTGANNCCHSMFRGCTSLTTAVIPHILDYTNTNQADMYMYRDCTSLTTVPTLPATSLWTNTYNQMFSGCTALTTGPYIKAATGSSYAMDSMFNECTSLNYVHVTKMPVQVYGNKNNKWLYNVAATGTVVCDDTSYTPQYQENHVPIGWTYTNTVPEGYE